MEYVGVDDDDDDFQERMMMTMMMMMMMLMMMVTPMWVLAGLTSHLVKWLLRWLGQIKVCLSTVPFDRRDHDDDAEMAIMKELEVWGPSRP